MNKSLRTLMLVAAAATAPMAVAAEAETLVLASIYNTGVEVGAVDATPRSLALDVRRDMSDLAWIGAQFVTGIQEDAVDASTDLELDSVLAVQVGVQHEFTDAVKGYAFLGFGMAEVSMTGAGAGSADGTSFQYGVGATFFVGEMGDADAMLDVGWAVLFDDSMGSGAGSDVTISGPHVGFGLAF